MKPSSRQILATTAILVLLAIAAAGAFAWSGAYNIGADSPHWGATNAVIETLRERSISSRLEGIQAPDVEDPERIRRGAVSYSAMCTGCHLSPGIDNSELRAGLYPIPPNLTSVAPGDPRRTFWVIKHGIKLTAMPAWGATHSDEQMWNMVAFLHKLPGMSPAQYESLGGKPPSEDEGHMHADGDEHPTDSSSQESTETSHGEADAELGEMHTHADGTTERHPKPAQEAEHKDDGHQH